MKEACKKDLRVDINLSKYRWAKTLITKQCPGDVEEEFVRLHDYIEELKVRNEDN